MDSAGASSRSAEETLATAAVEPRGIGPSVGNVTLIDVALLDPHPMNPRLELTKKVLRGLKAQMRNAGFNPAHAIVVRKKGTRYEVLSGHTRLQGALDEGVTRVPCIVLEMNDAAAVVMLGTANVQAPLSKLEHALNSINAEALGVTPAEYGRACGINAGNLSRYRQGARLFLAIRDRLQGCDITTLRTRAEHLAEIQKAPVAHRFVLAVECGKNGWSLSKTRKEVAAAIKTTAPADARTAGKGASDSAAADATETGDTTGARGPVAGDSAHAGDGPAGEGGEREEVADDTPPPAQPSSAPDRRPSPQQSAEPENMNDTSEGSDADHEDVAGERVSARPRALKIRPLLELLREDWRELFRALPDLDAAKARRVIFENILVNADVADPHGLDHAALALAGTEETSETSTSASPEERSV